MGWDDDDLDEILMDVSTPNSKGDGWNEDDIELNIPGDIESEQPKPKSNEGEGWNENDLDLEFTDFTSASVHHDDAPPIHDVKQVDSADSEALVTPVNAPILYINPNGWDDDLELSISSDVAADEPSINCEPQKTTRDFDDSTLEPTDTSTWFFNGDNGNKPSFDSETPIDSSRTLDLNINDEISKGTGDVKLQEPIDEPGFGGQEGWGDELDLSIPSEAPIEEQENLLRAQSSEEMPNPNEADWEKLILANDVKNPEDVAQVYPEPTVTNEVKSFTEDCLPMISEPVNLCPDDVEGNAIVSDQDITNAAGPIAEENILDAKKGELKGVFDHVSPEAPPGWDDADLELSIGTDLVDDSEREEEPNANDLIQAKNADETLCRPQTDQSIKEITTEPVSDVAADILDEATTAIVDKDLDIIGAALDEEPRSEQIEDGPQCATDGFFAEQFECGSELHTKPTEENLQVTETIRSQPDEENEIAPEAPEEAREVVEEDDVDEFGGFEGAIPIPETKQEEDTERVEATAAVDQVINEPELSEEDTEVFAGHQVVHHFDIPAIGCVEDSGAFQFEGRFDGLSISHDVDRPTDEMNETATDVFKEEKVNEFGNFEAVNPQLGIEQKEDETCNDKVEPRQPEDHPDEPNDVNSDQVVSHSKQFDHDDTESIKFSHSKQFDHDDTESIKFEGDGQDCKPAIHIPNAESRDFIGAESMPALQSTAESLDTGEEEVVKEDEFDIDNYFSGRLEYEQPNNQDTLAAKALVDEGWSAEDLDLSIDEQYEYETKNHNVEGENGGRKELNEEELERLQFLGISQLPANPIKVEIEDKKDSEKEEDNKNVVSPTEWFSGVIKNIGAKTIQGLDKIYDALEVVDSEQPSSIDDTSSKIKEMLTNIKPDLNSKDEQDAEVDEEDNKFKQMFSRVDTVPSTAPITNVTNVIGKLASQTKSKLTPAMVDLASKVKRRITEMPKRRLTEQDLDVDLKSLLFAEPGVLEALERIQVTACRRSIELKQLLRSSLNVQVNPIIRETFRVDPVEDKLSHLALDSLQNWTDFEEDVGLAIPDQYKIEMVRVLILAKNPSEALLQAYSSLESAPETLTPTLFRALLLHSVKCNIVAFMQVSLDLLADLLDQEQVNEINLRLLVKQVLSELQTIRQVNLESYEDIAIGFPELTFEDFRVALQSLETELNPTPMAGILREVYYAYEPIVTLRSVLSN